MQVTILKGGLQMPYLDDRGDQHDASVWFPVLHTEDRTSLKGSVVWYGWGSLAAWQDGKQTVGEHVVSVEPAEFLASCDLAPQGANIAQVQTALDIYLAQNALDTQETNDDGSPKVGADGQPVMRSFFQGATLVLAPITITLPDGA